MSGRDTKNRDDRKRRDGDRDKGGAYKSRDRQHSEKDNRDNEKEVTRNREFDGNPDIDREKYRQRLNDRDRDRDNNRRRHRDREERSSTSDTNSLPAQIVLLRRPTAVPVPSTSSSLHTQSARDAERKDQSVRKENESGKEVKSQSARIRCPPPEAPVVLQRPSTSVKSSTDNKDAQKKSVDTCHTEKSKLSLEEVARKLLEPFRFPENFAIPVIDKDMKIRTLNAFKFFHERGKNIGDYFIITAVGRPLTGKSTILSYLASNTDRKKETCKIFPDRSRNNEMESFMYITQDNVIIIEMASIFNCTAAYELSAHQGTLENTSLTWNLKLMRWALAISHIVLIVSDNLLDMNICQLASSAEMIHPLESALGEGVYPEIIFVFNKVPQSSFSDEKFLKNMQVLLSTAAGRNPRIQPNFFMIPEENLRNDGDINGLEDLRSTIFKFIRQNLAPNLREIKFSKIPQKYNAYDWYSRVGMIWEAMQHPNYFAAYVKLFP